ncbi:hypothetical protein [Roseibium sp.]|uniref:hypothetical protein n=1 Tax=Roseibium sp. TaxID=1936156 RepID=UPI003A98716D
MFRILPAIAFLIISTATAAAAEHITVRANRTEGLGSYVAYNGDICSGQGAPHMYVGRKPKHGKLTFKPVRTKFSQGRCKGVPVRATAVYYTPDRGFKGEDSFSFYYTHDLYEGAAGIGSTSYSFRATVK